MYIIYYNNYSTLRKSPKLGTTLMWQSGKVAMWQLCLFLKMVDSF